MVQSNKKDCPHEVSVIVIEGGKSCVAMDLANAVSLLDGL